MRYIVRGIVIIIVMLLLFMFMTACAPNRGLTRDNYAGNNNDKNESDINYGETDNFPDEKNERMNRKRIYNAREQDNQMRVRSNNSPDARNGAEDEYGENDIQDSEQIGQNEDFFQKGMASWYGREFHGRLTASGEKFDMNELSAAHRTLPFGTIVMVKDLENGRSIRVRINDRGPYRNGRILDLSFAAARQMNMLKRGEAKVGIRILKKGDNNKRTRRRSNNVEPVAGEDDERYDDEYSEPKRESNYDRRGESEYSLQAGAFYSKTNAVRLKRRLSNMFNNPVVIIKEGDLFKVRVEGIKSKRRAKQYQRKLDEDDISSFVRRDSE